MALVLATTAAATYVVLIAGTFGVTEFRIGYDVIAIGALLVWLAAAAIRRRALPPTQLMPAIVACVATFTISTSTSRVPRLSIEMLGYALLLAGLYLLAVDLLRRPEMRAHFGRLALVLLVIVCVAYLVQVVQAWLIWWDLVGRLALPPLRPAYAGFNLGSPNPLATLVLLLAAAGLGVVGIRGRPGAIAATTLVVLVSVVVLLTASRGAWLGAAAALAVTMAATLLALPDARRRSMVFARSRWGAIAAIAVGLLTIAATAVALSAGRLTLVDDARQVFTAVSLRMFESSPLTGTGPGTWPVLRAAYTTVEQPDLYVPHAHSVYSQLVAEFGWLGLIAGGTAVSSVGLLVIRALRSGHPERQRAGLTALFSIALLAVQQTVDMFMNIPAILFAAALPIAWLDAIAPSAERTLAVPLRIPGIPRQLGVPLVMAGIVGITGTGLIGIEATALLHQSAVAAANAGDWRQAQALAQQAVDADPGIGAYQFTLGVAAANSGDLAVAERALSETARADDFTYAWLNVAAVRWQIGDIAGAQAALSRAERLGLQRPSVALPAGWLRQQLGDTSAAVDDYTAALLAAPTLAADPFWSSDKDLQTLWPRLVERAHAAADARTRLVLDLSAGDYEHARQAAMALAPSHPALYEHVVAAWTGDATAWGALEALAVARPSDGDTLAWCQLIAEQRRDRAASDRYALWSAISGSLSVRRSRFARVATSLAEPMVASVFDSYELLYRRPVPNALVAHTLPQVVLAVPD